MFEYYYWLVVWSLLFLDPSDGVFGRFGLAALLRLPHDLRCLFVCFLDCCLVCLEDSKGPF